MITHFANPHLLWLLLALIPMIAYYVFRQMQGGATIRLSTTDAVAKCPKSAKYYLRHLPFAVRCIVVALVIIAISRPQSVEYNSTSKAEGIDIVLAIDVSSSMLARDFEPDRLEASKTVAAQFINERPNDRIGIVVFAGESFTQSPLTTDKRTLLSLMQQVSSNMIEDGTAIGSGLATAVNRLRESDAKSKVIILLTDGVNNRGQIAPLTAAGIAQTYGIKVYTIGVGKQGTAPYPAYDAWGRLTYVPMQVEIDEDILRQIAVQTGGEYFRATDSDKLKAIYDRINSMEKTEVEVSDFTRHTELFQIFVLAAILLLLAEFLLQHFWLRQIP